MILRLVHYSQTTTLLRERYFGSNLELKGHKAYEAVWDRDSKDITDGGEYGGESVQDVAVRVTTLLEVGMEDLRAIQKVNWKEQFVTYL